MIIFVGGGIGAGKSAVAKALAEHLSLLYYDVDEHKRVIYRHDPDFQHNMDNGIPFCKQTRMKVYEKVVSDFAHLAKTHQHLVVDETLHKKELRHYLFAGAKKYFSSFIVVWVKTSEETILQRLGSKVRKDHLLKDPMRMQKAFMKEFEPFEQSILVCRNDGTLEHTIKELKNLFDTIAICSNLTRA